MTRALVYLDREDIERSADLAEAARRLYPDAWTEAAVFAGDAGEVGGRFDVLHCFEVREEWLYDAGWVAECLRKLQEDRGYDCIVIPATAAGRRMAPALAAKLKTGIVADVVDVSSEDGNICMIRPAFEGKLMACIVSQGPGPVVMTVRPGVFRYQGDADKAGRVMVHEENGSGTGRIRLIGRNKQEKEDIRDARVLISGGAGVGERFQELQKLAEPLHGMLSSSRSLVDAGITPRSIQVGQSGKIVSPRLYMALGIYGSLQHIEGLNKVGDIIAVNTNKNAPICSLASVVVEGDALEFVDRLSEKIKKEKEK